MLFPMGSGPGFGPDTGLTPALASAPASGRCHAGPRPAFIFKRKNVTYITNIAQNAPRPGPGAGRALLLKEKRYMQSKYNTKCIQTIAFGVIFDAHVTFFL